MKEEAIVSSFNFVFFLIQLLTYLNRPFWVDWNKIE